jgi:glycolate oxidase FAD binding subunit
MAVLAPETLVWRAGQLWGPAAARLATTRDRAGECRSTVVLEPCDAAMAAAMLAWTDRERLSVAPRGSGTKLDWGLPPATIDVLLSTAGLRGPIDHRSGDLVATIPAGWPLGDANHMLSSARQWLPLDPPFNDRATIGGIVASGDSGPRRHRYGTARDLIIGVELALCDGRIAKAGGRVVKNVAGYDLMRLVCGSCGSLAVITTATFKLAPIAEASRTLVVELSTATQLGELTRAILAAPLAPSAVELEYPPARLLVRFETTLRAVEEQTAATRAICHRGSATVSVVSGEAESDLWRKHDSYVWGTEPDHPVVVKVSVLPSNVAALLDRVATTDSVAGARWRAAGRAALGVLLFALSADSVSAAEAVAGLRRAATGLGGTACILTAPLDVRLQMETWRDIGDALPLMRSVKAQFDPNGTLGHRPF